MRVGGSPGKPGTDDVRCALVVEDDGLIAMMVETLLAGYGFRTVLAPEGSAALDRIARKPGFDLAVVDLRLPDMWGGEVVRALWASRAGTPVVVSTGYDDPPPQALPDPGDGPLVVLRKPWTEDEFGRALAELGIDVRTGKS